MNADKGHAVEAEVPLFYEVFKACPLGIALENLEGQLLFVNPALCAMLGFSQEEMRNRQLRAGAIKNYQIEKRFKWNVVAHLPGYVSSHEYHHFGPNRMETHFPCLPCVPVADMRARKRIRFAIAAANVYLHHESLLLDSKSGHSRTLVSRLG